MIESHYWRVELRSDLAWLKKHRTYRRWSEKQQVLFERRLMLAAFQVRSLLERPKVNEWARSACISVLRYKKIGGRPFTVTGPGGLEDRFDMAHPERATLSALDVCNQLIHYYWMQTWSEGQSFVAIHVFSDYMRNKWAYEFRVDDLLQVFHVFCEDSSAILAYESQWDEKKQDYVITKSRGATDLPASASLPRTTASRD